MSCIMNCCHKIKRPMKSTTYKFNAACVKQFEVIQIYEKTNHDSCITTKHLHTLPCLCVSYSMFARCDSCDFSLFLKIKKNLKRHRLASTDDHKSASLKKLEAIPNSSLRSASRIRKSVGISVLYLRGITLEGM